jgi:hypothetical protein
MSQITINPETGSLLVTITPDTKYGVVTVELGASMTLRMNETDILNLASSLQSAGFELTRSRRDFHGIDAEINSLDDGPSNDPVRW